MFKFLISFLIFSTNTLASNNSYSCPAPDIGDLKVFTKTNNYKVDLKQCLEEVKNLCDGVKTDLNEMNLNQLKQSAFERATKSKDFHNFYCQNFKNNIIDHNFDRKCSTKLVQKQIEKYHSCDDMVSKDHNDYETTFKLCDYILMQELKKDLTNEIKDKFEVKLNSVIDGYKEIYKNDKNVITALSKISKTTNYNYRLSSFVAGARDISEFSYECDFADVKPTWCDSSYIIAPGGRVFSHPENLELILAHEVGHIINKESLPENEFSSTMKSLKGCNHLNSKGIDNDLVRSEASADIHMSRYYQKYMKPNIVKTHFCKYDQENHVYSKENYLHPYHRQALINCSKYFNK